MNSINERNTDKNLFNKENFNILSFAEREKLNYDEKIAYYKKLKDYYLGLPYNSKKVYFEELNYLLASLSIGPVLDAKFKHKLVNCEEIPNFKGPVIFVSNHLDNIDPPIIMRTIKSPVHLLLKTEYWGEKLGNVLDKIGVVFVDRDSKESKIKAKEELIKLVLHGRDILLFPEGTRNKTDKPLLELEFGALNIAQITGAPIVAFSINREENNKTTFVRYAGTMSVDIHRDLLEARNELAYILTNSLIRQKSSTYIDEDKGHVKTYKNK